MMPKRIFSAISDKINKGQGSLGMLLIDSLYNELNNSSKELNLSTRISD